MSANRTVYLFGYVSDGGTGGFIWNDEAAVVNAERAQWLDGTADVTDVRTAEVPADLSSDDLTAWIDDREALWTPVPGQGRPLPRLGRRENRPVVEVRDHESWWHSTRRVLSDDGDDLGTVAEVLAELDRHGVDAEPLYDSAVRTFWDVLAEDAAHEVGYGPDASGSYVYSAGRSGGWLYPADPRAFDWYDYSVSDEHGEEREYVNGRLTRREDHGHPFWVPGADLSTPEGQEAADEYADAQEGRATFLRFARAIARVQAEAGCIYLDRLAEAVVDLRERQNAAIVLGEN